MVDNLLKTHQWTSDEPREIKIEGKLIFHHHCRKCGRDFAREASQADWKAVYIGTFSVKFLDDSVGQQWVSDPCPGLRIRWRRCRRRNTWFSVVGEGSPNPK